MSSLTIATITNSLTSAHTAYLARKGEKANTGKTGINPDFAKAFKIASGITDAQLSVINDFGINDSIINGLRDATNSKKPMRTLQALLYVVTGDGQYLRGSAKTFMLEFCGLTLAGAKTRSALAFSATGRGNENTSDEIKIAKARAIMKKLSTIGVSSESTQNSVAFSKGGIAEVLGVARKDSRTGMPVVNLDNKVAVKLDAIIRDMTDGKLELLVSQASGK